jgi:hypothetical protein
MPVKTYPNKITFKSHQSEGKKEATDETVDFALKMRNAIDVELIDTNLYMSKELWLPFGSRGAFGGQVMVDMM